MTGVGRRSVRLILLAIGWAVGSQGAAAASALPQACQDAALSKFVNQPETAERLFKACHCGDTLPPLLERWEGYARP